MEEDTRSLNARIADAILAAYRRDLGVEPPPAAESAIRAVRSEHWQRSFSAGYAPRWFSEDGVKKFIWY